MKIFIAGATGTLGLPVVRALVARGHTLSGLARSPEKGHLLEEAGATPLSGDLLDTGSLSNAVHAASPDCVLHLATALPKSAPLRYSDMRKTNELRVTGTANLLQAAVSAGVQRIVAESMIFAYGFGDHGPRKLTEADRLQPREQNSELQVIVDALRTLEEQVLAASREGSIEAVPLRYGLFYGSETPSTVSMEKMIRRRMMPTATGASSQLSFIHIQDAVNATVAAVERGRAGEIYNIVDDEPLSMNEWILQTGQALGAPRPPSLPLWLLRRMMPYVAAIYTSRLLASNAKAKEDLGWQLKYPTYQEGLREVISKEPSKIVL